MHKTVGPAVSKYLLTRLASKYYNIAHSTIAVFDSKDTASQSGRGSLQKTQKIPLLAYVVLCARVRGRYFLQPLSLSVALLGVYS